VRTALCSLLTVILSLAACQAAPTAHVALADTEARWHNGPVPLAGVVVHPASPAAARRLPGAVIIQGSGPSDRSNKWARAIAEELARTGMVVLLPDKRGSGQSGGDWRTATFDDLAQDALAGLEHLATRGDVDPRRIGVIGLSQGGFVAPLAAVRSSRVAFVVAISAAATPLVEQVEHEMRNTFRQAGLAPPDVEQAMKIQHAAGRYLTHGDWESYAALLRDAKTRPWAGVAAGFPPDRESWVWAWWRPLLAFDPMDSWKAVRVPALLVYGADDEHDNVPVRRSVERLRSAPAVAVAVIPGTGHSLYAAGTSELHPEFKRELRRWVRRHVH